MNLDKIRKMNDNELRLFLQKYNKRDGHICIMCGKPSSKTIKIENKETTQTKMLCGLCNGCYRNLLQYLDTYDLGWDR